MCEAWLRLTGGCKTLQPRPGPRALKDHGQDAVHGAAESIVGVAVGWPTRPCPGVARLLVARLLLRRLAAAGYTISPGAGFAWTVPAAG